MNIIDSFYAILAAEKQDKISMKLKKYESQMMSHLKNIPELPSPRLEIKAPIEFSEITSDLNSKKPEEELRI